MLINLKVDRATARIIAHALRAHVVTCKINEDKVSSTIEGVTLNNVINDIEEQLIAMNADREGLVFDDEEGKKAVELLEGVHRVSGGATDAEYAEVWEGLDDNERREIIAIYRQLKSKFPDA